MGLSTPAEDLLKAWGWLERWGHHVDRLTLDELADLGPGEVFELLDAAQQRVKALAEEWEIWWTG